MLGAVVYELAALKPCRLPSYHGGLLHGAFFKLLGDFSPELATYIHDLPGLKPFAISQLLGAGEEMAAGTRVYLRIAAWDSMLLAFLESLEGQELMVGRTPFRIERLFVGGHPRAGFIAKAELVERALSVKRVSEISVKFLSPVAFRRDKFDYPVPTPEYFFPSLADKCRAAQLPIEIDRAALKEVSALVLPSALSGHTERLYYDRRRGVTGFRGEVSYDVSHIGADAARLLLLLAQLSVFTGAGRLTAQGLGETEVRYKE